MFFEVCCFKQKTADEMRISDWSSDVCSSDRVNASGLWPGKVVTEVTPVGDFWEAEPEHQDYLERYPNGYTCHSPRSSWVLPKRKTASESTATPALTGVDARS